MQNSVVGQFESYAKQSDNNSAIAENIQNLMEEIKKRKWIRKVYGDNAGLHVIAEIESHFSDEELTKLAQGIGIRIYPISEYYIDKNKVPEYPAILLGYGGLTEKEIEQGFRELDKIMLFF